MATAKSETLYLYALFLIAALPILSHAQTQDPAAAERRTIRATRMDDVERIEVDGRLDEGVWARATPAADFIQIDPRNGAAATEPTEVRIVFSKDAIYMGVTCYDSEPDKWLGFQRRRDEFLPADDRFMWTIDTFLDERSGYFFEMNPSGLMADSLFGVNGDNRAWDGIWNARVVRSEIGWTIEIEIPFRTLNFDPNNDTWGMNFQRTVRRKNEDSIWMGWAYNQGLRRMTNAGHVTGIQDVTQGLGLDIKPYGLVTSETFGGASGSREKAAAGLDLFYNPTPGIRANLTLNTDFAQTEVDQRQVNLTRFSLFFPERRDFFLDGAIFFDFASDSGSGPQVQPFFSRRIGLSETAEPQPIDYGAKITGQMGGQDVGFLHVRTSSDDGEFIPEDFTVARVKRRVLQQSYFGAIYTRRDPHTELGGESGPSQTAGADFRLATSQFRGNQNLSATAWFLHATKPGVNGQNNAFGAVVEYPNDIWQLRADVREVQGRFDPAVGFVLRNDYRRYRGQVYYGPRPRNSRLLRRIEYDANLEVITDLRNLLQERLLNLTFLNFQFQSQDNIGFEVDPTYVRLDRPFTISPGITLPFGESYNFIRYAVRGQTANRRKLALNWRYETGGFYSGHRDQSVLGVTVRARPGYIFSLNGEWNQIDLAEGSFSTNIFRGVADTQFTPFMALVNIIQFDNVSRVLGWQSRYRWILKPGNDLYVVYTHNWVEDPILDRFATFNRRAASKLLYTHRF